MWSEHCAYKHSKKLLGTLPTEGKYLVMGPGENAGAVDVGRRPGVRLQGRVAQPPQRGRAVPGSGHRGRRHPARHLRGGRAADRHPRLAPLRRARLAAYPLSARSRGGGHRPLRQLDRCRDRGRRDLLRGALRAELPGERHVPGPGAQGAADQVRGRGSRQRGGPVRGQDRPRRDRRRVRARQRGARRGRRVQAPERPDRRSVRGEPAAGVLPGAARDRSSWPRCRTWAPRGSRRPRRRWPPRARSASISMCRRCRSARRGWRPSRS